MNYSIFAGLALTALGWKQGIGPLQLLTRLVIYLRAIGYVAARLVSSLPEEWARLWEPALARARREV